MAGSCRSRFGILLYPGLRKCLWRFSGVFPIPPTQEPLGLRHLLDRFVFYIYDIWRCSNCRRSRGQIWTYCKWPHPVNDSKAYRLPASPYRRQHCFLISIFMILPGFPRPNFPPGYLSGLSLLPSNGHCLALLPHKNKGLTVGITVGGSSLGVVIWPIVLNELLNTHGVSFGWTIRAIGFIVVPLLILAIVTVVSPPQTKQHSEAIVRENDKKRPKRDLSITKDPTFIILCAGLSISVLGMYSPMFYITTYARSVGHPIDISFYLVSVINGSSLFGRILPGLLADRYGHFNLCALAGLASGITSLCWTTAKSIPGLAVWCLVYGFTSGVRVRHK